MSQFGIIVASFGSVYAEAVEKSVDALVEDVNEVYPDAVVERVFLSLHWWKSGMNWKKNLYWIWKGLWLV